MKPDTSLADHEAQLLEELAQAEEDIAFGKSLTSHGCERRRNLKRKLAAHRRKIERIKAWKLKQSARMPA
jgi:hypothetical protein